MRIGVIGLGAIGGVVAQRLPQKPDVATRDQPLRAGAYDFILLCTRTTDLETALAPAAPLLAADGAVVCLQNGLPEERAARIVGRERVLGTVIGWSADRSGEITGKGKFILGGDSPRLPEAAGLLRHVFPVQVTQNLQGARWSKLAMNCAMSTLGAVSGLSLGEMAASRRIRRLALQVMREVVDIAKEKAVRMERVSGLRPDKLVSAPAFVGHAAIWLAVRGRTRQRTGMIARLRAGRSAGIEDLNALIPGPINQALTVMVREIEAGKRPIDPRNLDDLPR